MSAPAASLEEGFKHHQAGHIKEAHQAYMRVLEQEPENPSALYLIGTLCLQTGNLDAAAEALAKSAKFDDDNLDCRCNLGIAYMQLDRAEEGFNELKHVLDRQPNHPSANLNIGKAYLEAGALDFAEKHLRSFIKSDPKSADGFLTLGIVLSKKGALENAVAALRRALNLMPGDPDARLNLANVLLEKGDEDEAISHYLAILDSNPEYVLARYHLGLAYSRKGELEQAIEQYRLASKIQPGFSDARINYANLLMRSGRLLDAEKEAQEVVRQTPENGAGWGTLSSIQLELGKYKEAKTSAESAIDADPGLDKNYLNLAIVYKTIGDFDQAFGLINTSISLNPDNPYGYYNRALINFLRGNFSEAIDEYEFRWNIESSSAIWREYPYPIWQLGDNIEGKKIFVWSEQGVGDHLLYAKLLSWVADKSSECVFECDGRLADMFSRSLPNVQVVKATQPLEDQIASVDFDFQIPLASLMRLVPNWPDGWDNADSHLVANIDLKRIALERMGANADRPLIGISWRSGREGMGAQKSVALREWVPILKGRECTFVNLQYGDTDDEIGELSETCDVSIYTDNEIDRFNDLDQLLGLIDGLDLIITTSNVTAHLAGGLGKPCLLLLPINSLWYWGAESTSTPFYPSVIAYRQENAGDWLPVINAVADYLDSYEPIGRGNSST